MTGDELRSTISTLGWSQAELGRRCENHPNTVTAWCKSDRVPGAVAAYVSLALRMQAMSQDMVP